MSWILNARRHGIEVSYKNARSKTQTEISISKRVGKVKFEERYIVDTHVLEDKQQICMLYDKFRLGLVSWYNGNKVKLNLPDEEII